MHRWFFSLLVAALILPFNVPSRAGPLYLMFSTHNEQPHFPDTPDFTEDGSLATYRQWREGLKNLAEMCVARGIRYNSQNDWNFLEGVRKWEIDPATAIPGITATTDGKNIIQYIYDLGQATGVPVEIDPHSHENFGYTYADVAWLIRQCGVEPAPVVGGHTWDDTTSTAVDFDRFRDPAGVVPAKYRGLPANAPNWHPEILMGLASAGHVRDPSTAGLWRPASATDYHTHATNGPLVAIGSWHNSLGFLRQLMDRLDRGELPHGDRMWATDLVMNHRDFQDPDFLTHDVRAVLDTLKTWQDQGRLQTTTYLEARDIWETRYGGVPNTHIRPDDNLTFSLNWQDFYYVEESAHYLDQILTLHEERGIPLDVFFTTWQTDLIEARPELLGRLQSSARVAQGYHVRPPKPYADGFAWGPMTHPAAEPYAVVMDYETHGLDLVNGTPTAEPGGYGKLTTLQGYSPLCVGAQTSLGLQSNVYRVFQDLGARLLAHHGSPVNLGQRDTATGMPRRPEHWDWKLIALWTTNVLDPQPATLSQAFAQAHASAARGGNPPWFVGVKLHDNDLFARQSQWSVVYPRPVPPPWNTNAHAARLSEVEEGFRFASYSNLVVEADRQRLSLNVLNSFDTLALLQDPEVPPIGLTRTSVIEAQPTGTVLAEIRGGGILPGQAVTYRLVSGAGDTDNADFQIVEDQLLAATVFDYESHPTRHFRIRWEWIDALGTSVLAAGERALTLRLRNSEADDDDGDGLTEAEENAAGTDPGDSDSVLAILSFTKEPGPGPGFEVTVFGVTGRVYSLQGSDDLISWTLEPGPRAHRIPGSNALLTLGGTLGGTGARFYRVMAQP